MTTIAQPLRAIWILNWLDFAVCNGSLLAYFFNTHGRRATLAAEVLRALGAHRMADVLTAAERSYRSAEVAWAARHQELSELGQYAVVQPYAGLPNADELGELTDRYWQAAELDNWGDTLEVYLREQVFLLVPPRRSETSALGIEPTATDQVDGWIFEENVGGFSPGWPTTSATPTTTSTNKLSSARLTTPMMNRTAGMSTR